MEECIAMVDGKRFLRPIAETDCPLHGYRLLGVDGLGARRWRRLESWVSARYHEKYVWIFCLCLDLLFVCLGKEIYG
jgi:hypothetical protein